MYSTVMIVNYIVPLKVDKGVDLKSYHHNEKKIVNYVWWLDIAVIISQYIQIMNHHVVDLN